MSTFVPTPSGETVKPPFHIQNKFIFYDIAWEIEHFFVQTCEENWEIGSPELHGPRGARLKLILKSSRNEDIADSALSFTVRRSDSDSGPETLWVNYRVVVSDPNVASTHLRTDKLCSLSKGSESEVDISGMSGIFDEGKNLMIKIDSLRIDCKVVIYSEGEDFGLQCSDAGIMKLSEDMLDLLNSGLDFDIEVKIGNSLLQLHRSVLCSRCEWFTTKIEKAVKAKGYEIVTVDLSNVISDTHCEGMGKIVAFFYTGNLKHVLEKPSLEVYDLAYELNIEEIKTCYTPETLHFLSTVDAEEFEFNCYMDDFKFTGEYRLQLVSPTDAEVCSARTWDFHFDFRNDGERGFLTMYAETNEEIKSMNVYLRISAADAGACSLGMTKMLRKHVDGSKRFGIDESEFKNWRPWDEKGDLHLSLKMKSSTGKQSSYIRKHFIPASNTSPASTAFNKLSLDMKALFESGEFYDADFLTPVDLVLAHRCILAARCRVLYDRVTSSDGHPLFLRDMTKESLFVVLCYLYSGMIYEMEDNDVDFVLAAAEKFKIPFLTESCLKFILANLPKECTDVS